MCNYEHIDEVSIEREAKLSREEYQILFNDLIRDIAQLLEVSGNETLIRAVKKKLYNFSDHLLGDVKNAIQDELKNHN